MMRESTDFVSISQDYFIGMPQLSLGGLSENWLFKECGHQHWLALAKCLDIPTPHFTDQQSRKMYAAFLVVKVRNAAFSQVSENSQLWIDTRLKRVSPSRSYSHHAIFMGGPQGRSIAEIELLSSFVSRAEAGNNQSVARGEVVSGDWSACDAATQMMAEHKAGRHIPENALLVDAPPYVYQPCPYTDFNGADFLYFAQFQSVMDRAERFFQQYLQPSDWFGKPHQMPLWQTSERTICYYGNINLDDGVETNLFSMQETSRLSPENERFMQHCGRLYRQSDNTLIANVMTRKCHIEHSLVQFNAQSKNANRTSFKQAKISEVES